VEEVKVISLGGSIIIPDEIDIDFLKNFYTEIDNYLKHNRDHRLILVCGGGDVARAYQKAFRALLSTASDSAQDFIGIAATRLNAELLKQVFYQYCQDDVVTNPTTVEAFSGRILVAAGWKPGFSTDFDAVLLAEKFAAKAVINLSNIKKVYSADPKLEPSARPLDSISWAEFRKIVGDTWTPGKNVPFDPVAANHAAKINLKVIVAYGRDIPNLRAILDEKDFNGTIIGT
jgi:uridylate kinase